MATATARLKVLVTGSSGQLGQELEKMAPLYRDIRCIFTTRAVCDITNLDQVCSVLDQYRPDVIINAAAYTAVDRAETEFSKAALANTIAVKHLAQQARERDMTLIHISTDYVFDGHSDGDYTEEEAPNPQSVYGRTKLAGERAILEVAPQRYAIIRTSWLYSAYGNNFVKTMLRLSAERSEVSVVDDQVGSPTWGRDLANAILQIVPQLDRNNSGMYHYSNVGEVSWYAFAKAVFSHTQKDVQVTPITTEQYPTAAERPKRSVIDGAKISRTFDIPLWPWEESLKKMLGGER